MEDRNAMEKDMMVNISNKRKKDWLDQNIQDEDLIRALNVGAIDVEQNPNRHEFRIRDRNLDNGYIYRCGRIFYC